MNLFVEIQNDILSDKPVSAVLRKARVFAHQLKNQNFNRWVESELNGYSDEKDFPDYRKIISPIFGNFIGTTSQIKNAPVSMAHFPKKLILPEYAIIGHGVAKIEGDIEAAYKANKDELEMPLPSTLSKYFKYEADPHMICVGAWKVISRQQLIQILETTRDRLQKFVLELSDLYPEHNIANNSSVLQKKNK